MATNARGLNSSPGIYTREIDLTYSAKSLGITTLGLVGETQIGPAFEPVSISNFTEFKTYFGGTNPEKFTNGYPKYELPYIAKSYLSESNQLYVTRVLGLSGFRYDGLWSLYNTASGSTVEANTVLATLRTKSFYSGETQYGCISGITLSSATGITGTSVEFTLTATYTAEYKIKMGTTGNTVTYKVSLNPNNKNYILSVLGNSFNGSSNSLIFVEEMFEAAILKLKDSNLSSVDGFYSGVTVDISIKDIKHDNYLSNYTAAKTPWFVSEVKGNVMIPLFRFHTISDGENANNMFKVSITNVDPSTLKFDVIIRSINDTDAAPIILDSYKNCNLDPVDKTNYIGAKTGTVDGLYDVKSKYIILEANDDKLVAQSVPMGVSGYEVKNIVGYKPSKILYNITYNTALKEAKQYFGLSDITGVDTDFFKFNGIDASGLTLTDGFHLQYEASGATYYDAVGSTDVVFQTPNNSTFTSNKKLMKFTTYFYGGFDGWDVFRENRTIGDDYQYDQFNTLNSSLIWNGVDIQSPLKPFKSFDGNVLEQSVLAIPNILANVGITSDFYAYWSAARTFSNPNAIDINVFATPGIDIINNTMLVNEVLDMLENERKDSIYIVTTPDKSSGTFDDTKQEMNSADVTVVALGKTGIDTSYAATYFPWCKYNDVDNNQFVFLSPTRDVVRNIAMTDNTAYAWFPPAGLIRGMVNCERAKKNLVLSEENTLYNGRINVVKTFAQDGIKIWGQKTLQVADTQLNRIGARRLMLYLRKIVGRVNLPLIFEPNDNTTKSKFLEIVNPIMNGVKSSRGISDFEIQIDDSVEAKARHEMNVVIWVKPIGALEYINIDFVLTPEGFDFNTM